MLLTTPGVYESISKGWPTAWLVDIDWPVESDPPAGKFWDGLGTLVWNGIPFQGVRHLGRISGIGGSKAVKVREVTLELRGVGPDVSEFLEPQVRNRRCDVWFAGMDRNGARVNGEPELVLRGRLDRREVFLDEQRRAGIRQMVTDPIYVAERPQDIRYTPEWIKATYGENIKGLDLLSRIELERIPWTRT